jgi:endonuclease YncB( thermonuclease family)
MASVSAIGISVVTFRERLRPFTFLLLLAFLFYPNLCVGWQGKVVGISDGDTITVLNEKTPIKVRLCGIDCPEKSHARWI